MVSIMCYDMHTAHHMRACNCIQFAFIFLHSVHKHEDIVFQCALCGCQSIEMHACYVCAHCSAFESVCSNWARCGFPRGLKEVSSDSLMQTCRIIVPMIECCHHLVNLLRVGIPLFVHCTMHHGSKTGAPRHCCSHWFVCWQEVVSPFLPFGFPIAHDFL